MTMVANGGMLAHSQPMQKASVLRSVAEKFGMDPNVLHSTIKATCFKDGGGTDAELVAFLSIANKYQLDPFTREIFAFPKKGGGVQTIVSVDGWAKLANAHPMFDGLDFHLEVDEKGEPVSCTCTVYRKDRGHPVRVTEYLKECRRDTEPWRQWPRRMLRHKALKEAVRLAFSFAGIVDEDEAEPMAPTTHTTVAAGPVSARALVAPERVDVAPWEPAAEDVPQDSHAAPDAPHEVAPAPTEAEMRFDDYLAELAAAESPDALLAILNRFEADKEVQARPNAKKLFSEAHIAAGKRLRPRGSQRTLAGTDEG